MTLPNATETFELILRAVHVLAGILWIGLLYFLNLVNVPLMKELDGPTKGKVIPAMLPRVLFLFRWSAMITWVVGFVYFVWLCSRYDVSHAYVGAWFVMTLVFYAILYVLLMPKTGLQKDGRVLGAIIAVLSIVYLAANVFLYGKFVPEGGVMVSHILYIGIGGGYGTFMFLNVWGIIWRNQKKIIAWTKAAADGGPAAPPEAAVLGRQAFLASRTNAWLSLPMLLFMVGAAHVATIVF